MVIKKIAKAIAKTPFKVAKGVIKHRRKIVGGGLATGAAIAAIAKKDPRAALKILKTGGKVIHTAGTVMKALKGG